MKSISLESTEVIATPSAATSNGASLIEEAPTAKTGAARAAARSAVPDCTTIIDPAASSIPAIPIAPRCSNLPSPTLMDNQHTQSLIKSPKLCHPSASRQADPATLPTKSLREARAMLTTAPTMVMEVGDIETARARTSASICTRGGLTLSLRGESGLSNHSASGAQDRPTHRWPWLTSSCSSRGTDSARRRAGGNLGGGCSGGRRRGSRESTRGRSATITGDDEVARRGAAAGVAEGALARAREAEVRPSLGMMRLPGGWLQRGSQKGLSREHERQKCDHHWG